MIKLEKEIVRLSTKEKEVVAIFSFLLTPEIYRVLI
jgi:hypothetical protein